MLVGIFCNESLEGLVKAMVIINSNTAQLNEFPFCLFHRHTARITAGMTMKLTNETWVWCSNIHADGYNMYKCYCFSFADLFFSAPGSSDPCFFVGISFLSFWDVSPLNLVFRSFNCWFTSFVYEGKSPVCGFHILLPLFYFFLCSENIGLFSVFWRFLVQHLLCIWLQAGMASNQKKCFWGIHKFGWPLFRPEWLKHYQWDMLRLFFFLKALQLTSSPHSKNALASDLLLP